jgi:spore coat polysaccharide biosynthesis protein SpsF|tara:strand:+ start:3302 stop:4027 length:726 start_codon:yes stop_codon:yes gene_type:complete
METAIILQARLDSKRLPGKVLMKINGKTILEYTIKRLKKTSLSKNIIVATTKRDEDQKIIKVAKKMNCYTFRGSSNNVLDRYYKAASYYKVKNIARVCSDSPLIDPNIIDEVYFFYLKNNYDYVSNKIFPSYPVGMGVEILNFQSLKKANRLAKNNYEKEHVTAYIYRRPKKFKIKNVGLKKKLLNYRLVLDYTEDFMLISNILKHFNKQRKDFTLKDIIKYIDGNLILKKINSQNLTKYG